MRLTSTTLPATTTSLPKSPPPKTSSDPIIIGSQNVAKTQSPSQSVSAPINEEIFRENSDIDHLFEGADENFPELDSYGVGWESRKLASWKAALMAEQEQTRAGNRRRRKREAYEPPLYYSADRTRLSGRPQLWRGGIRERQYGEPGWERQSLEWGLRERQDQGERRGGCTHISGFWEEEEFDSDFFHGGRGGGLSPQLTYAQAYQHAQEARSKRRPSYRPAPARERCLLLKPILSTLQPARQVWCGGQWNPWLWQLWHCQGWDVLPKRRLPIPVQQVTQILWSIHLCPPVTSQQQPTTTMATRTTSRTFGTLLISKGKLKLGDIEVYPQPHHPGLYHKHLPYITVHTSCL